MTVTTNGHHAPTAAPVPPSNLDAERSLLGAVLLAPGEVLHHVIGRVEPGDFYSPAHREVFSAVLGVHARSLPVDAVTVADELQRVKQLDEAGGRGALLDMQATCPAVSNAATYADLVIEAKVKRRLIEVSRRVMESAFNPANSGADVLERAEGEFYRLSAGSRSEVTMRPAADLVAEEFDDMEWRAEHPNEMMGFSTGFTEVDAILRGLRRKNMYVLGGRPAMGKSSAAFNIIETIQKRYRSPSLLRIMEMSHPEVMRRFLSSVAAVNADKIEDAHTLTEAEWRCLSDAKAEIAGWRLEVDENPNTTVADIRAKGRYLKSRYKDLGLIVVDYAQLMGGGSAENRQVEMSAVSRGLRNLAKELDAVVLVLVQLNRKLEDRSEKRPQMADIRESGSFEQDASAIMLLYREEVYNPTTVDKGIAEVHIVKNRFGKTGVARLQYRGHLTRFGNLAHIEQQQDDKF